MFENFSNSFLRDFDFNLLINRFEKKIFKTYRKGDIIFKHGDMPEYVYFILSGNIRIGHTSTGRSFENYFVMTEGDILGIDDALRNEKYLYTAESDCDTNIMIVPKNDLISLKEKNDEFNIWLLKYLCSRITNHE